MNIKAYQPSETFKKKLAAEKNGELKAAVIRKSEELTKAIIQVSNITDLPYSLKRASNMHPFRRADVNRDYRIYWWIEERTTLIYEDYCDHKEAEKKYGDAHNVR